MPPGLRYADGFALAYEEESPLVRPAMDVDPPQLPWFYCGCVLYGKAFNKWESPTNIVDSSLNDFKMIFYLQNLGFLFHMGLK